MRYNARSSQRTLVKQRTDSHASTPKSSATLNLHIPHSCTNLHTVRSHNITEYEFARFKRFATKLLTPKTKTRLFMSEC